MQQDRAGSCDVKRWCTATNKKATLWVEHGRRVEWCAYRFFILQRQLENTPQFGVHQLLWPDLLPLVEAETKTVNTSWLQASESRTADGKVRLKTFFFFLLNKTDRLAFPAINSRWELRFGKRKVWFAVHVRIKNNKVEGCNINIIKGETGNFPSWLSCWGLGKQGLRGFFEQETMVFVLAWKEHDSLLGP